jgi:hypothetical protein
MRRKSLNPFGRWVVPMERELVGQTFGRLAIIGEAVKENGKRRVFVQCLCGTKKVMYLTVLKQGRTKSCGCLKKETDRARRQKEYARATYDR